MLERKDMGWCTELQREKECGGGREGLGTVLAIGGLLISVCCTHSDAGGQN